MIESLNQIAAEALAESLESMAFLAAMPAEQPYELPTDSLLLSIGFSGMVHGSVEMVAARSLGKLAICNMLCTDPGTPAHYDDALKELVNIFGGYMLRRWNTQKLQKIEMSLPELHQFDAAGWPGFINTPGVRVLDVEGHVAALRVRMGD